MFDFCHYFVLVFINPILASQNSRIVRNPIVPSRSSSMVKMTRQSVFVRRFYGGTGNLFLLNIVLNYCEISLVLDWHYFQQAAEMSVNHISDFGQKPASWKPRWGNFAESDLYKNLYWPKQMNLACFVLNHVDSLWDFFLDKIVSRIDHISIQETVVNYFFNVRNDNFFIVHI